AAPFHPSHSRDAVAAHGAGPAGLHAGPTVDWRIPEAQECAVRRPLRPLRPLHHHVPRLISSSESAAPDGGRGLRSDRRGRRLSDVPTNSGRWEPLTCAVSLHEHPNTAPPSCVAGRQRFRAHTSFEASP
ncbi:unnamed protein product, partial [Ixodes persulcatus]